MKLPATLFLTVLAIAWTCCLVPVKAVSQDALQLHFSPSSVQVTEGEKRNIELVFSQILAHPVSYHSGIASAPDLRLSVSPSVTLNWHRSRYQYAPIPAIAMFYIAGVDKPADFVGSMARPYLLNTDNPGYPLDDVDTALLLMQRKRISAIIDYAANAPLYQSANNTNSTQLLQQEQQVFIEFPTVQERDSFDDKTTTLLANGVQLPIVDPLPAQQHPEKQPISWLLINKYFDRDTNTLIVSEEDNRATRWWQDTLPQYALTTESMNSRLALARLNEQPNVCILNVLKNTEREQLALFTDATAYYLHFRLYALSTSLHARGMQRESATTSINLKQFIQEQQSVIIGYSDSALKYFNALSDTWLSNPQRFINVDSTTSERAIKMLTRGRIDYLLDYPTLVKEMRYALGDTTPLVSFSLDSDKPPTPAHIACSKSSTGNQLVQEINAVLRDLVQIESMLDAYVAGMSESETRLLRASFLENASQPQ